MRFLSQHIALLSHPGTSPAEAVPVLCAPCDERQLGGFHPEHGVLICSNRLGSKKLMEDTLAHEMTHLFDERRFKVDWHDLKSHACSEVCLRLHLEREGRLLTGAFRSELRI